VHTFEVVRTEQVTPHLTRVVLGGDGFDTFTPNDSTDAYVKIVFVQDGIDVGALQQPLTLDSFKALPAAQQPPVRTYTVRPSAARSPSTSSCTATTASPGRGPSRPSRGNRPI
jgi:NADPH-dependent ferric siderophore reductase